MQRLHYLIYVQKCMSRFFFFSSGIATLGRTAIAKYCAQRKTSNRAFINYKL